MAYSLYHVISTSLMENNNALDCLLAYLEGDPVLTKEELRQIIKNAKEHNKKLRECSIATIDTISKEIF